MAACSWSVPPWPSPGPGAADHNGEAGCVPGQVPEVGRDECILCLITVLMRPQVKSEHAKEPPEEAASQESINHLLPLTFSAINPQAVWQRGFQKAQQGIFDYRWYLMSAADDLLCHQRAAFIFNLLHRKSNPGTRSSYG